MKNWNKVTDTQAFKDAAVFSANFWGYSCWGEYENDELCFELNYNDYLGPATCFSFLVDSDDIADLRKIVEKYGDCEENYIQVAKYLEEKRGYE
jgi:hypothetical protein